MIQPVLKKIVLIRVVIGLVLIALVAPPLVQVCECACGRPIPAGLKAIPVVDGDPSPASCCCDECCAKNYSTLPLCEDSKSAPGDDGNPACCCESETSQKLIIRDTLPLDNPRSQEMDIKSPALSLAAMIPDCHQTRRNLCTGFQKYMTPTHCHIASTVLLI